MRANTEDVLRYYKSAAPVTDIETHREFIDWLTDDVEAIFRVVQGLLIHDGWFRAYGIEFDNDQRYDFHGLGMASLLDRAMELDSRSLSIPRAPERRVLGCCREFATLMTAILRAKGIPARARCGFAAYFDDSPKWEDHWLCEYWNAADARWILADPQMDPFQQSTLKLSFSPLDIPRAVFMSGGEAWAACRAGTHDPDNFGISCDPAAFDLSTLYGLWFVRGNLLRDVAALNKVETVPLLMRLWRKLDWRSWRLVGSTDEQLTAHDLALLDKAAAFAGAPDERFTQLRTLFDAQAELQPGRAVLAYEA